MPLLPSTQTIIETVERLTDRPVHIREDASLDRLARITVARGDAAMHVLSYKPAGITPPDYFIAYQCGFVIRLFTASPEKRFDIGSDAEGRKKIMEALTDVRIPNQVRTMADYLLDSLVSQLRTYPVGLRVDNWLHDTFPELRGLQKLGIQTQLQQNVEAISVAGRGMFPRKVANANMSMNAAFALFWSRKWDDPALALPYKASGYLDTGRSLINIFDRLPDDPNADLQLIDEWAYQLKLKGWYVAVPHVLNP